MVEIVIAFIMMLYQVVYSFFILLFELYRSLFSACGGKIPSFEDASIQDKLLFLLFSLAVISLCIVML